MRLRGTPSSWHPRGPTVLYRTPPSYAGVVGCGVLVLIAAALAYGVVHDEAITRFRNPSAPFGSNLPTSLWALLLGALAVGALCSLYAVRTVLVGHNGVLELDPAGRRLLRIANTARVLEFAEIAVLVRRRYDVTTVYTNNRTLTAEQAIARGHETTHRLVMQLVAMPSDVVLYASDAPVHEFERVSQRIAATIGVPVA